ncbi:MAG: SagB/ThcOx family dehydrogenase [Candidatus Aminicenantales bacterium]
MDKAIVAPGLLFMLVLLLQPLVVSAQQPEEIKLLAPQTDSGKLLMQALLLRQSVREFSSEKLPFQVLSNLLWAANGVNRPDSGKRTAPSAMNVQNIEIYAATSDGLYLYDPVKHVLKLILKEDVRPDTGKQDFVKVAPLNLIYVADLSKFQRGTDEDKLFYSAAHVGFISQNVYLYCASTGLATVVRGMVDKEALAKRMNLRPDQKILLAQTVGYPKKAQ